MKGWWEDLYPCPDSLPWGTVENLGQYLFPYRPIEPLTHPEVPNPAFGRGQKCRLKSIPGLPAGKLIPRPETSIPKV
jgi:hypothetical protein